MNPSLFFNREWYLQQNPDLAQAVRDGLIDPEQHFLEFGIAEGRSPLPLFNEAFYLRSNPDVAAAVQAGQVSAIQHFLAYGLLEPRAVNPFVHLGDYLSANPDVAAAVEQGLTDPLSHLLNYGLTDGRDLGNGVSLALFADDPAFKAALEQGKASEALARVAEVAPFLPDFQAPEGWTPPADTPVPVDFTPPAGIQLVVPASVKVPDSVTLPPHFSTAPTTPANPGTTTPPDTNTPPGTDTNAPPNTNTPTVQTFTPNAGTKAGSSDASTAIALDANYMVVGDDEASVLRVYNRAGGEAVREWSFESSVKGAFGNDELDLEAGTRIGDTLYFIGSHSNKKSGAEADSREFLFSVSVEGTGKDTTFGTPQVRDGLETLLVNWDSSNAHGKGANYFGFAASSGSGVIPENTFGFSIEGMSVSLDGKQLLLGFRAPQSDTGTREKAVIVPLNLDGLFGDTPTLGDPIELDLGGRGIRSLEKAADNSGYLILAGPAMSASTDVTHDFRLFRWDGQKTPEELDVSLDTLRDATGGSFETLVEVSSVLPGTRVQLLQDNGDTVWEGQTKPSKDLNEADQKFVGNWITLGNPVSSPAAPTLVKTSPTAGSDHAFQTSNIELMFNQGVKRGEGTITLKAEGETDRVIDITDTTQVSVNFNTVVINPTDKLAAGKAYTVEISAGAVAGWAGLTGAGALSFTTATPPDKYNLLISEVNSNATGDDFFELYNYGETAIDLSGWKWTDSAGDFANAEGLFPAGTIIQAGQALVVVKSTLDTFLNAWNLPQITHPVVATGGPGLGKGDAIVVFNADGFTATAFNYGASTVNTSDGQEIAPQPGGGDKHAGEIVAGGSSKGSAVWDGVSTETPVYVAVDTTAASSVVQADNASKGSPGVVLAADALPRYSLLISEVNSNATGGDFFELHNFGESAIDLSGWRWTDSANKSLASFASGTTLAAGDTLIVINAEDESGADKALTDFKSAWQQMPETASIIVTVGGPGLGGKDGVVVLDNTQKTAAAFNYGDKPFTAPDGTTIAALPGGTGHAGVSVGGIATTSAIWDGKSSPVNPVYVAANVETQGSWLGSDSISLGSPGMAKPIVPPVTYDLLISEVNSAAEDGDFFELYNHGDTAIDLSGWSWTDSAGTDIATFSTGTVLNAGQTLVVVSGAANSFTTNWGLTGEQAGRVVFTPAGVDKFVGLGKNDAVLVMDAEKNVAAAFNYGSLLTKNGTNVATSEGVTFDSAVTKHAGVAVGGAADSVSAVWNGVSTEAPVYVAAQLGVMGVVAHGVQSASIGSPGTLGVDLMA